MPRPPTPNSLSVSKIKSNLLNLAQTSVYLVKVQPTPDTIKFLSSEGRDVNYYSLGENIELLCSETNLPGSSLATHEVTNDYPGVTEKFAYRRIYDETIDFTFYVDKNYNVVEFLDGWMNYVTGQGTTFGNDDYVNKTRHYRMNYPNLYKTDNLYITKFEKDNQSSMTYQFIGAFPINIVSMPISYDASSVLKCTASFSYIRYIRKRDIVKIPPNFDLLNRSVDRKGNYLPDPNNLSAQQKEIQKYLQNPPIDPYAPYSSAKPLPYTQ